MPIPDTPTVPLRDALKRGLVLHKEGKLAEAERWFRAILDAKPGHFDALNMLGIVAAQGGRLDEADELFRRAVATDPQSAIAHTNRANVLRAQGRNDEALASIDRALAIDAHFAQGHINRATILKDLRRYGEALASSDRALAIDPASAEAFNIKGAIAQDAKRFDEALASYDRALVLQPEFAEALSNRGGLLIALKRYDKALADCDRALALKAGLADALYNRGLALSGLQRHAEAAASYERALAIKPHFPMARFSRAGALASLQRHREAADDLELALALDPAIDFGKGTLLHARMHCGDWRAYDQQRADVIRGVRGGQRAVDPFAFLGISESPPDQLRCAQTWVDTWYPPAHSPMRREQPRRRDRIHVAYLSADFREHAVAFLAAGLFERHDRTQFEVTALSFGGGGEGEMRTRLEKAFDRFIEVQQRSDAEIANLMHELEIDIAVNLGGYTASARTGIFALRPAPVQVNFLGYAGTMGAPYIDYIVADRVVIPDEEHAHYSESVVHLPDSFQVNDAGRRIADYTPSRREAGLPDEGFVFCSFNSAFKITPAVFARWMRVLHAVEGSVLWLLERNAETPVNLRREAAAHGIAPERLVFAKRVAPAEHLARHRLADLFLDTSPFNGSTTASDALWTGLPVVTCRGTTFAGRVAASLLHAIGLPELIAATPDEYEALAIRMATDPEWRTEINDKLARHRASCALFDTDLFRRHLEEAFMRMWDRCLTGQAPAAFAVAPSGAGPIPGR